MTMAKLVYSNQINQIKYFIQPLWHYIYIYITHLEIFLASGKINNIIKETFYKTSDMSVKVISQSNIAQSV